MPVLIPELTITTRAANPPTSVAPGGTVRYTLTIHNTGQADYPAGTTVTDDLSGVLDDATYLNDVATDCGRSHRSPHPRSPGPARSPSDRPPSSPTRSASTTRPADRSSPTSVTSDAPGANCAPGNTESRCTSTVTVLQPVMTITKTADLTNVVVGGTVHYSIVVTNDGEAPYTGVAVVDTLVDVLDAGAYEGNASATTGTVTYTEPTLTWTGDLAIGATVVITYSVRATGGGDNVLANTVASTATGSTCAPDDLHRAARPAPLSRRSRSPSPV